MLIIELTIATIGTATISTLWLWTAWLDRRDALRAHRLRKLEHLVSRCH